MLLDGVSIPRPNAGLYEVLNEYFQCENGHPPTFHIKLIAGDVFERFAIILARLNETKLWAGSSSLLYTSTLVRLRFYSSTLADLWLTTLSLRSIIPGS